jgi:hypothetical protein
MIDIEKHACNFFVLYPCPCQEHYASRTFNDANEFISFIGSLCNALAGETITDKFPLTCGVTRGNDLPDCMIYAFDGIDATLKPIKAKWIGEGTLNSLGYNHESNRRIPFIVKKNVDVYRSRNTEKFFSKCLQLAGSQIEI